MSGLGIPYDGASPQYDSTTTRIDKDGREVEAFRVQAYDRSTRSTANAPAPFGPNDTPQNILGPIEKDIAAKREMLDRFNGFDPRTGAPNWAIQGERRTNLERELQHLTQFTLPIAQQQAKAAAEWHASQPNREERLREEQERRQAIFARAEDIADQLEAERQAEAILRARGKSLHGI